MYYVNFSLLTISLARPQGSPYSLLRVLLGPGSAMAGCMSAIAPEASVRCVCVCKSTSKYTRTCVPPPHIATKFDGELNLAVWGLD